MPNPFMNLHFHVSDKTQTELDELMSKPRLVRGVTRAAVGRTMKTKFDNDEAAARFYLSRVLENDDRPALRGLTATPELVPNMRLQVAHMSPLTKTRLLRFEQTQSSISVFGSQVVVELGNKRELIAINGKVAALEKLDPVPSISQKQALANIAKHAGIEVQDLMSGTPQTAQTTFYHDENTDKWHLAYFFQNISAALKDFEEGAKPPEEIAKKLRGHGLGASPRRRFMRLNYLVDAHEGNVLLYYSAMPTANITVCVGLDELDANQKFYGLIAGEDFEMSDELRKIKTYNLAFKDIGTDLPNSPVRNKAADFANSNKAAVSAHVNATRVYDFYKSILMRDGVDDKAMELVSIVNCTYSDEEEPPQWRNAVWWDKRMWYGQTKDANDHATFRSFSRYLDIIAHELTHGVTENTSNLIYRKESGALNESFSDIFGVIISNWYDKGANSDPSTWNWEIGAGLGEQGLPLRDMSDPKRTDDPDHMDDYRNWPPTNAWDWGGVHVNSNIHNKAAYNFFTAKDETGKMVFPAQEVAVLYYLCLSRLGNTATFTDALQTLVDVANTFYAGEQPENKKKKIKYITDAYEKVGIVIQ